MVSVAPSLRVLKTESKFCLNLVNHTLVELLEEYIKHKKLKNAEYRPSGGIIDAIVELEKEQLDEGDHIMPEEVTDIFYNIFIAYLGTKKLRSSTINNYCSFIKSALSWGANYGIKLSPTFNDYHIDVEETEKIALSPAEVFHIAYFDIEKAFGGDKKTNPNYKRADRRKNLEKIRDQFILSICLGQRYSDMVVINPSNFEGNIFTIRQQKTGNIAKVNIDDFAIDKKLAYSILEKYGYTAPYPHDRTHYAKGLRELLEGIGCEFLENIAIDRKINGVMQRELVPKYKLITSHTARRTFITLNLLKGFKEHKIRKGSGHKDMRSFQKYICTLGLE